MSGLRDAIKRRMETISRIDEVKETEKAPPSPADTTVKPAAKTTAQVLTEAEAKAARFKWERENPGKPYPSKADGGMIGMRKQMGNDWRDAAMTSHVQRKFVRGMRKMLDGGKITGMGGPTEDKQPIMASPGEYILPADTAATVGIGALNNLVAQTHEPVGGVRRGAVGGAFQDEWGNWRDPVTKNIIPDPTQAAPEPSLKTKAKTATGSAWNTVKGAGSSLREKLRRSPTAGGMQEYETWKAGPGTYERIAEGATRNQPMTPSTIDRKAFGPTPQAAYPTDVRLPEPTTRGVQTPLSAEGMRQPGVLERVGKTYRAMGGASGATKTGIRAAGKSAPLVGAGMEVLDVNADLPYLTEAEQAQRGIEGIVTQGTTALGGVLGGTAGTAVAGPVGMGVGGIGGSIVGSQVPKWVEQGLMKTGVVDQPFLPSSIAEDRRGTQEFFDKKREEILARKAAQQDNAMQAENEAVRTSLRQPPRPQGPQLPVGVSEVDTTPYGIRDTTSPEVLAADRANRARWTAEANAIDTRMAERDRALRSGRERMVAQTQLSEADLARERAIGHMERGFTGFKPALQSANYRTLEANKRLTELDNTATELTKTKAAQDAARFRDEMGLRGQQYASDKSLEGHKYTADSSAKANAATLKYNLLKLRQDVGDKNLENLNKLRDERLQVFTRDEKGNSKLDPEATYRARESFNRFMLTPTVEDKKLLQSIVPGAQSMSDVPPEQWGPVIDRFNAGLAVTGAVPALGGDQPTGLPSSAVARERGVRDAFAPEGVNSNVGVWNTMVNNLNPLAPAERNFTVRVAVPGSKPVDMTLEDLAGTNVDQRGKVLSMLEQSGDPTSVEIAKRLRDQWKLR